MCHRRIPLSLLRVFMRIHVQRTYNKNTLWLREMIRQTSRGKSAADRSSRRMSSWPYRVTTKYFYPVPVYKVLKVFAPLTVHWNKKSIDLMTNYLSIYVLRRLPSGLMSPYKNNCGNGRLKSEIQWFDDKLFIHTLSIHWFDDELFIDIRITSLTKRVDVTLQK